MAKELLVGSNGNKKTTDFYTWKNGTMYRVTEGYVWKNGTMYQFYGADGLIPKMTSNTLPYGVASAGDGILNSEAYYAYDRETNTWVAASAENQYGYVIYEFDRKVNIERVVVTACKLSMGGNYEKNYTIKVSVYYENDWHEYGTFVIEDYHGVVFVWKDYTLANGKVYNVEKIKTETLTEKTYGSSYHISKIQAYGEYSKTRVPHPQYDYDAGQIYNCSSDMSVRDILSYGFEEFDKCCKGENIDNRNLYTNAGYVATTVVRDNWGIILPNLINAIDGSGFSWQFGEVTFRARRNNYCQITLKVYNCPADPLPTKIYAVLTDDVGNEYYQIDGSYYQQTGIRDQITYRTVNAYAQTDGTITGYTVSPVNQGAPQFIGTQYKKSSNDYYVDFRSIGWEV